MHFDQITSESFFSYAKTWMYIAIPVLLYAGERVLRIIRSRIHDVKVLEVNSNPMIYFLVLTIIYILEVGFIWFVHISIGKYLPWESSIVEATKACRLPVSKWNVHICSVPSDFCI